MRKQQFIDMERWLTELDDDAFGVAHRVVQSLVAVERVRRHHQRGASATTVAAVVLATVLPVDAAMVGGGGERR